MKLLRTTRVFYLAALAALLCLLAACQAAPTPTATPPPPAPTPAPPTATPAPTATPVVFRSPQGTSGGSLTVAATADVSYRDVHQEIQQSLAALGPGMAYSRLLRLRSGEDLEQPHLLLECDLCESWELTRDLVYEFKLRPDVLWQDIAPLYGRPLVAADLVFSYDRMRTPGWPNAALLSSLGAITAPDERTLRVDLAIADADVLVALADGHSKIVAPEVVERYGDLKDSPVIGTGPWTWESSEPGEGTVLLRNRDYFEDGLPFLDELRIAVIKQDAFSQGNEHVVAAAYTTGLVDVAPVMPREWDLIRRENRSFESTLTRQMGQGTVIILNSRSPVLRDQLVRRAVFQAIDPWDYLDTVWPGEGFASLGVPVQRADWLLERVELRQDYFADPVRARSLLSESGPVLPLDIEVAVHFETPGELDPVLQEQIVRDLQAVGFNPLVRPMNPQQYNELVLGPDRDFEIAIGPIPPASTTNGFLFGLLHSRGQWNVAGHEDSGLDALIEEQAKEFDSERRERGLAEIQRHVLEQGYLFSPVTATSRWVYNSDLRGFAPNTALSEYNFWSRVWLDRS